MSPAQRGLEVHDLAKRYGAKGPWVLERLDLSIERGELVALLGPNGAGKSTLVKAICGLLLPDRGSIRIAGRSVTRSRGRALRALCACLEGDRNLYHRLTVRENVHYFLAVGYERVDEPLLLAAAERLGLASSLDRQVRFLTKGTRQKAALLVPLLSRAPVVVLDEPTVGLDVQVKRELQEMLRALSGDGRAVLLTTHELDVAESVADRIVILKAGRVRIDRPAPVLRDLFREDRYSLDVRACAGRLDLSGIPFDSISEARGAIARIVIRGGLSESLAAASKLSERGVDVVACQRLAPTLADAYLRLIGEAP
ncbi:MAG: ABC transporter ATP-binding protein [Candidatus Eisenbacteria bacterium]|nr:ABC transporter ATP-binding protein [Candidatus Eisenbacteria bacterium]